MCLACSTNKEVRVHYGALVEGTRHRSGKGPRATEGPVEAIDETLFRAKAKRRKAAVSGELAGSSEVPISTGGTVVLATRMVRSLLNLPKEICRVPIVRWVASKNERTMRR